MKVTLDTQQQEKTMIKVKKGYFWHWYYLVLISYRLHVISHINVINVEHFREGVPPSHPAVGQYTICPRSSDPFYIVIILHKMGHYFLNILYNPG